MLRTNGSGRLKRALVLLAVLGALGSGGVIGAPPAKANVHTLIPADSSGDIDVTFNTNMGLYTYFITDLDGGQICVVEADSGNSCEKPAFAHPHFVFGIGTSFTLLKGPELLAGTFQLRAEVETESGWALNELSDPFVIHPCVGVQCTSTIEAQQAQAFKDSFGNVKGAADGFCLAGNVSDVAGEDTWSGRAEKIGDGFKQYQESKPSWGSTFIALGLGIAIGFLPDTELPTTQKAIELLHTMSCRASKMANDIKQDPPDPNFTVIAQPQFGSIPQSAFPDPLEYALAVSLDRQEAFGVALLHSYERYQGAVGAGNMSWKRQQARATSDYTQAIVDEMRTSSALMKQYSAALAGTPDGSRDLLDATEKAAWVEAFQRVRATGFTQEELDDLEALGYTPTQIAAIKSHFDLPVEDFPVDTSKADVVQNWASTIDANLEAMEDFATHADAVATNDAPPTADFSSSDAGERTRSFSGAGSSPDGDPLTYEWDFGDGQTTTGQNVLHTFATGGVFDVTLTVREPFLSASVTKQVTVTVSTVVANDDPLAVTAGTTGSLNVLTNDSAPSGQTKELTDFSATSANGATVDCSEAGLCTYTAPEGEFGPDTFTYTVTASGGTTDEGTVNVTVEPLKPGANADSANTTTDTAVPIDVLANDVAPEGSTLELVTTAATSAGGGSVSCVALVGPCTYAPPNGFNGIDQFSYTVKRTDVDVSSSALVTISVNPPAVALPTATEDDVHTTMDHQVVIDVLANDDPAAGETIAVTTLNPTSAAGVSVTCTGSGSCTYNPPAGFVGYDQFLYGITSSPGGGQASAIVTVHIDPPPPPTANADEVTIQPGASVGIDVRANDVVGQPGDTFNVVSSSFTTAQGGSVSCSSSTCNYTARPRWAGVDSFDYTIVALSGAFDTATVTVNVEHTLVEAVDDSISVRGAQAFDVLQNDDDDDGDPFDLVSTSVPEHGSLACDHLGGCIYTAATGYTGPDSFTYTLDDPSEGTDTATVTVTVLPISGGNLAPVPVPDQLSTTEGLAGNVNVLTNDSDPNGDALTVTGASDPSHGAASCDPGGVCTYTPDPGFSGIETFTYVVSDGSASATGLVTVGVTPLGAALSPTATGVAAAGGTTVTAGDDGRWTVGLTPGAVELPQELTGPLRGTGVAVDLSGAHTLDGATPTPAPGWTWDEPSQTFVPSAAALLGNASIAAFPQPLAPISQGTGGDGHVPILIGSKVFALFHHTYPTSVTCVDRSTGTLCPGYPRQILQGGGDAVGPAAVIGHKFYVHVMPVGTSGSVPISMLCWDADLGQPCGLVNLERNLNGNRIASAPVVVGGKLYLASYTGWLHCYDPATSQACATPKVATGLSSGAPVLDIVTHGTRIFVASYNDNRVACIDTATNAKCVGWVDNKDLGSPNVWTRYSPAGAPIGVCGAATGALKCVNDDAPNTVSTYPGPSSMDNYYSGTAEAETGTRTFYGSLSSSGLGCWDWVTNAPCTGGQFQSDGWLRQSITSSGLPSAYGASWDGSCVVGLGDPGQVFTVDPAGSSPCTSLSSGAARIVDLRSQRCDNTVGGATWQQARVTDVDLEAGVEFTSLVVTVRDALTNAVLATKEMVGTGGTLDLSGIDPELHPSLKVDATATSALGNPAWADGTPPKLVLSWNADPAAGCFDTNTVAACSVEQGSSPLGVLATAEPSDETDSAELTLAPVPCSPRYHAIAPSRILDTRDGTGAPEGKVGQGQEIVLDVTGVGGVPATGVAAVVLNVIADAPSNRSHLRIYPDGAPLSLVSSLNFDPGETISTSVIATVGENGNIRIFNNEGSTHVVADVSGWFDLGLASTGARYHPVDPARILDTREGIGAPDARVGAGETVTLDVTGPAGVPAIGVTAVALNLTAVSPSENSHLRVWPEGPTPLVTNLNFPTGVTIANMVVATVGADGNIRIFNNSGDVDIVADIVGWFDEGGVDGPGTTGDSYRAIPPSRILDTRDGTGVPAAGALGEAQTITLDVTGVGGTPATGVDSVVLSLTADRASATSHLRVWPSNLPLPVVSSVNFSAGDTLPNLVIANVAPDGTIKIFNNSGEVHVVADVVGWFSPAVPPGA